MTEKPIFIEPVNMTELFAIAITSMEEAENLTFLHYDPHFVWVDHRTKKARRGMFVFQDNGHHRLETLDYITSKYQP